MKLVTFENLDSTRIGAVTAKGIVDLSAIAADMLSLIRLGAEGLSRAAALVETADKFITLSEVKLLAPIPYPRRNVMCLGLNYAEHAEESLQAKGVKVALPEYPMIFTKGTNSINGPYDDIPYDASISEEIDWEVELGVVLGQSGKNISVAEAMNHVFGYTVLNDISARDLQWKHQQFFKGKSLDGCCPIGPWIVTADEVDEPHNLNVSCRVNGVVKQNSNTRHMIFNIAETIRHLSSGMTLLPGDIIATGTPSGVGFARKPPEFLKAGDLVECEVEGVGKISNRVVAVS